LFKLEPNVAQLKKKDKMEWSVTQKTNVVFLACQLSYTLGIASFAEYNGEGHE
jgi:hypothetical protein